MKLPWIIWRPIAVVTFWNRFWWASWGFSWHHVNLCKDDWRAGLPPSSVIEHGRKRVHG